MNTLQVRGTHNEVYYDELKKACTPRPEVAVELGVFAGRSLVELSRLSDLVIGVDLFRDNEISETLYNIKDHLNVVLMSNTFSSAARGIPDNHIALLHLDLEDGDSILYGLNSWKNKLAPHGRVIIPIQFIELIESIPSFRFVGRGSELGFFEYDPMRS